MGNNPQEPEAQNKFQAVLQWFELNEIIIFIITAVIALGSYFSSGKFFPALGASIIFLILGPLGVKAGSAIGKLIAPDVVWGKGFAELQIKKILWLFGPQFVGALIIMGLAASWAGVKL